MSLPAARRRTSLKASWLPYAASSLPALAAADFVWSKSASERDDERRVSSAGVVAKYVALHGDAATLLWAPMSSAEQEATVAEYTAKGWM